MDSEEIRKIWLQQNEKVCICKAIPRKRIINAIQNGADSLEEINRMVGSGHGECNGKRCGPAIEELLAQYRASNAQKR
jgi:NAD(P)H-nitrite reductase large subunit